MRFLIAFLVAWALNALALGVTAAVVPGVRVKSVWGALWGALALGFVSSIVAPVLLYFSLPVTVLTLGLFLIPLVGLLFWLGSVLAPGFEVDGCLAGFLGGLVLWLVNWSMGIFIAMPSWW